MILFILWNKDGIFPQLSRGHWTGQQRMSHLQISFSCPKVLSLKSSGLVNHFLRGCFWPWSKSDMQQKMMNIISIFLIVLSIYIYAYIWLTPVFHQWLSPLVWKKKSSNINFVQVPNFFHYNSFTQFWKKEKSNVFF